MQWQNGGNRNQELDKECRTFKRGPEGWKKNADNYTQERVIRHRRGQRGKLRMKKRQTVVCTVFAG